MSSCKRSKDALEELFIAERITEIFSTRSATDRVVFTVVCIRVMTPSEKILFPTNPRMIPPLQQSHSLILRLTFLYLFQFIDILFLLLNSKWTRLNVHDQNRKKD